MKLTLEKEHVNTFNGTKTDIIDEDNDAAVGDVLLEREAPARTARSIRTAGTNGRVVLTQKP
jgi:hypothetical protein